MRVAKQFKKNNGSTLTLVLFMLFLLSVTAIAVITLTGSELNMSVMSSDRSKALLIAQAGAEKAAQVVDEVVAQAQEDARVLSSEVVQGKINGFKHLQDYDGDGVEEPVHITAPFEGVIDNSDIDDIKIVDEIKLNDIYEAEYKFQFYKKINEKITAIKASDLQVDKANYISKKTNPDGTFITNPNGTFQYKEEDGKYTYLSVELIKSTEELESLDGSKLYGKTSIALISNGEYKSPSNGSIYKRGMQAEFSFLTKKNSSDFEIPISYGKLTKVRNNVMPSILSKKALVAEKNIISIDGLVKVKGDVICFGTIPASAADSDKIKSTSSGYEFGGIMAGMPLYNSSDPSNVWRNSSFVSIGSNLKENMKNTLGLRDDYFIKNYSGGFNINGSIGTMSYVHSLFGKSNIEVSENTFARSVKIENQAHLTQAQFKKIYTTNDLRIDASGATVKIGKWNGDIPDANNEGLLVGLSTGVLGETYSSAVAVNGDSNLKINGSIYIGGSTFYNEYINQFNDNLYISGMSIQKSDSRPAQAFEMSDSVTTPTEEDFPGNVFYLFNTDPLAAPTDKYISVMNEPDEPKKLATTVYNKAVGTNPVTTTNMMTGSIGLDGKIKDFNILDRTMHLKHIWEKFWKSKSDYYSYFTSGDIIIEPKGGNKLKGFCWGAVNANGNVYAPYSDDTGFTEGSAAYVEKKIHGDVLYQELMDLFITPTSNLTDVTPGKKVTANPRLTDNSVNTSVLNKNQLYITKDNTAFMYHSDENVVLQGEPKYIGNGSNTLTPDTDGYIRGIVYSRGDIYVKTGTKFKGILIAEGNIVFIGDGSTDTIDIKYDENVFYSLLSEYPEVGRFFKYSEILMNDNSAIIQTIKKSKIKNIKIINWKEIDQL